ncbi:MAG TPA: FMN-binding protein [Trebonia sp.]|jgi:uncharacterized protein with FMN-binding domain
MRRAVIVLGTTAAGLAALFSYKTHVAGVADASAAPTVTMSHTPSSGGSAAGSASARPAPSKAATKKAAPKPSHSAAAPLTAGGSPPTATHSTAPSSAPKTSAPAGKSGSFSGPAENTQYGQVQVSITVSNGKITNANGTLPQGGDSIAQNALPQLNQEVLTAQSASIQAVSGATYTSQGYIGSLQQAVNEAGL